MKNTPIYQRLVPDYRLGNFLSLYPPKDISLRVSDSMDIESGAS